MLRAFGLPLSASGLHPGEVLQAMELDKKVEHGRPRFVLLEAAGRAVVRDDVTPELVEETVRALVAS